VLPRSPIGCTVSTPKPTRTRQGILRHTASNCQYLGEPHGKCTRNAIRASRRNAHETVIVCRHGKHRNIADLQTVPLKFAKRKTEQLYVASFPSALPDILKGIQIKAS
jgi:hypothetical protein